MISRRIDPLFSSTWFVNLMNLVLVQAPAIDSWIPKRGFYTGVYLPGQQSYDAGKGNPMTLRHNNKKVSH